MIHALEQAANRSPRHNLADRVRFESISGQWASLGFPRTGIPYYRVWLHNAQPTHPPLCFYFPLMADALDFLNLCFPVTIC